MTSITGLLAWTPWVPLRTSPSDPIVPRLPGLYRIRRVGRTDLDYIGQTGLRLGQRLAMLRGAYAEEMPYRDPHTLAPALWALRHATGCDFEVSVTPIEGSTPWRKGLEALAIDLYRQEHRCSPTIEFGRVPVGYRPSSANNARLVQAGKRFRGGQAPDVVHASHAPGIPPVAPLKGDPQASRWVGHDWSSWKPMTTNSLRSIPIGNGLYRLRGDDDSQLLYIGQGRVPDRALAHLAKLRIVGHPQAAVFETQKRFEFSFVLNDDWLSHQRLELENDLIAAHLLHTGVIPVAQFLG
jgi:hypothetical protein